MKLLKIKINKQVLKDLKPCESSWRNYLTHYPDFEGDLIDLLNLEHITSKDKIWVSVRLLPRQLVEVFAIDCAVSASSYAAAADAAYAAACAADAAAYADAYTAAAYAAAYAAADARKKERSNQIEAIKYLILIGEES